MNAPEGFTRRSTEVQSDSLLAAFDAVRARSAALAAVLSPEDCQAQSMPDASPVKWHLAHTTWFFETFLLGEFASDYVAEFPQYRVLFNSYYNAVGDKHPRPYRGLLSRPTLEEVKRYRARVDQEMRALISGKGDLPLSRRESFEELLVLGLNHEQQHQELILTDVKHLLSCNPMGPAYLPQSAAAAPPAATPSAAPPAPARFVRFEGGIVRIGHDDEGFCFDNEKPSHPVLLQPFELADRLVTCGEYVAFVESGGYRRPEFWLSLGWDRVQAENWDLPFYWRLASGEIGSGAIETFTLRGWEPLDPAAPVAHLSFFEADAFARWAGARLPSEAEWEHAARQVPVPEEANLLDQEHMGPAAPQSLRRETDGPDGDGGSSPAVPRLSQVWGDLWEWTSSPYVPYPGFRTSAGAVGEYNGKFMCNQYVLRGGSFATSRSHLRASYRNFFPPEARWQFSGLRLARDCDPAGGASPRR